MTKRLAISMREELVEQIDEYARSVSLNRSAAIASMCAQYLQGLKSVDAVNSLTEMIKQYQKDGTLPTDEELDAVEQAAPPLSSKKTGRKKKA